MTISTAQDTLADHVTTVCPSWCVRSISEHAGELESWEARCIHVGEDQTFKGIDGEVVTSLSALAWFDGAIDNRDGDGLGVNVGGALLPIKEVERLAQHLLSQVATAREGVR